MIKFGLFPEETLLLASSVKYIEVWCLRLSFGNIIVCDNVQRLEPQDFVTSARAFIIASTLRIDCHQKRYCMWDVYHQDY